MKCPLLFALFVLFFLGACSGEQIQNEHEGSAPPFEEEELPPESPEQEIPAQDFETAAQPILEHIEALNYCEQDSECTTAPSHGCPFGCYYIVNKEASLDTLNALVEEYRKEFSIFCDYGCLPTPEDSELSCEQGKCKAPEHLT